MLDQFNASFPLARRSEANNEEGARREQAGGCRPKTEKTKASRKGTRSGTQTATGGRPESPLKDGQKRQVSSEKISEALMGFGKKRRKRKPKGNRGLTFGFPSKLRNGTNWLTGIASERVLRRENSQARRSFSAGRRNARLLRLRSLRVALDDLVGKSTHPPPFGRLHALHKLRTRPRQTQSKPRRNPRARSSTSAGGPCLLRVLTHPEHA